MNRKRDPSKPQCMGHTCVTTNCKKDGCSCKGCGTCSDCKDEPLPGGASPAPPLYTRKPTCGKDRCRCCPKCPTGRDSFSLRGLTKERDTERASRADNEKI